MKKQKSFNKQEQNTVYVVPTPIGNLEDITFRALKTLQEVSVIAAEDTRNTKKLLSHFEIATPLISYHEHNKESRGRQLLQRLEKGESIAVVSDAGMPGISDPGYELVQAAIDADYPVVVLPGANAALCALIGSGLPSGEFLFYGFLPRKKKEKEAELERLKHSQATLLLYESPYRVKDTLNMLKAHLGNRQVSVARELTKKFEEYIRGTVEELIAWSKNTELKGEFCLVIEGTTRDSAQENDLWWSSLSIVEHVNYYMDEADLSSKEAIKRVTRDRNMAKRDVYQAYHIDQ
ncbi:16S rRNA (cytidine(1402)-2'-O)-methyltransferase [Lentibacillus sp. CBA3610]|uniref:16S rRNA (cytidine(1402)-2'-O)-methyltransferase n=1 Tax=Lentibacillus sp. CBA3610 TaxID=2518176 RepID=UPI00159517BB|nr:16S rRNA (cytidine(1402)-2'-O)-methyltransferase [Lentibacillus sp. CBA3610]QKY70879.1 16S rRNA (cytidine(1402)-2'-O)-methyltransferase [Lentibacillus sp. CBA3610]